MIARDDAAERQKLVAYLAALRPKTLTASVAPALVGTGLCRLTGGMLSPTFLLLHTLPAFLMSIVTTLVNRRRRAERRAQPPVPGGVSDSESHNERLEPGCLARARARVSAGGAARAARARQR